MCQVMFSIREAGGRINRSRMRYCPSVLDRFPTLPANWTTCIVVSKFHWSPFEGCEGLTVENPVATEPDAGQHEDRSSDQETEDEAEDEMEESDNR